MTILVSSTTVIYTTTIKGGTVGENSGSTEGGSLLWIKGEGFSQDGFNIRPSTSVNNMIKLIKDRAVYDCNIQYEEVTDTRLACYTPAMPAGEYFVRIYIHNNWIPLIYDPNSNRETFWSSQSSTPAINGIVPASGLPQRLVSLSGDFKTNCYSSDKTECSNNRASLISR